MNNGQMMAVEKHGFYVDFEQRPIEDREASMKEGHPVFKDQDIAVITMPGGSLVVDKIIDEALLNEWRHGAGRKPPSPFAVTAYEAWKAGKDIPVNGIDLKNWPGVTPAQLKNCQALNIRTVEDLSTCDADALRRLGMGGVALKDKAISYLESAVTNKTSEEVSALKVEMASLKEALEKKDAQIEALMEELTDPKPSRKKKAA